LEGDARECGELLDVVTVSEQPDDRLLERVRSGVPQQVQLGYIVKRYRRHKTSITNYELGITNENQRQRLTTKTQRHKEEHKDQLNEKTFLVLMFSSLFVIVS